MKNICHFSNTLKILSLNNHLFTSHPLPPSSIFPTRSHLEEGGNPPLSKSKLEALQCSIKGAAYPEPSTYGHHREVRVMWTSSRIPHSEKNRGGGIIFCLYNDYYITRGSTMAFCSVAKIHQVFPEDKRSLEQWLPVSQPLFENRNITFLKPAVKILLILKRHGGQRWNIVWAPQPCSRRNFG